MATSKGDVDSWLMVSKDCGLLAERDVRILCQQLIEVVIEEANVQPVSAPVSVCGDLHGKVHDLLKLFEAGGQIPETRYVFMGDFVDRGYTSVEVI